MTPVASNPIEEREAPAPYGLWVATLTNLPIAADIRLLSPEERFAGSRFAFAHDERRYLAAHVALRKTLASCIGVPPSDLRFTSGPYGKPFLSNPCPYSFSLSRSGDVAVIAVAALGEIGVDVEIDRDVPEAPSLAALNFSPTEREQFRALEGGERNTGFLRCWTRKEACLKAIGSGLSIAPRLFDADIYPTRTSVAIPTRSGQAHVIVESLPVVGGLIISLARVSS